MTSKETISYCFDLDKRTVTEFALDTQMLQVLERVALRWHWFSSRYILFLQQLAPREVLPTCTQEERFSSGLTAVTHHVCIFHLISSAALGGMEVDPWHISNPSSITPATQCPLPSAILSLSSAKQDCLGVLGKAVHLHSKGAFPEVGGIYYPKGIAPFPWSSIFEGDGVGIFLSFFPVIDFMRSQTTWCWFEQSCEVGRKANLHFLHEDPGNDLNCHVRWKFMRLFCHSVRQHNRIWSRM